MIGSLVVLAVLLGLIPATIASRRGEHFLVWWIFGAALFIVALPMALMVRDHRYGECPWCSEPVRTTALVCPHCQREVTPLGADGEPDYTSRETA